jgi:hypothetical protein
MSGTSVSYEQQTNKYLGVWQGGTCGQLQWSSMAVFEEEQSTRMSSPRKGHDHSQFIISGSSLGMEQGWSDTHARRTLIRHINTR